MKEKGLIDQINYNLLMLIVCIINIRFLHFALLHQYNEYNFLTMKPKKIWFLNNLNSKKNFKLNIIRNVKSSIAL